MRILVAEDDQRIAAALAKALSAAGFAVDTVGDGEDAWFKGDSEAFDLVVLDLGLPKMDGLTPLKRWRKAGRSVPVLVLTARGNWDERVDGIEAGADDYVVKPFAPRKSSPACALSCAERLDNHRRGSRSATWRSIRAPWR